VAHAGNIKIGCILARQFEADIPLSLSVMPPARHSITMAQRQQLGCYVQKTRPKPIQNECIEWLIASSTSGSPKAEFPRQRIWSGIPAYQNLPMEACLDKIGHMHFLGKKNSFIQHIGGLLSAHSLVRWNFITVAAITLNPDPRDVA
jgi:hypothetical protein